MEIAGVLLAFIGGIANGSYPSPKNYFKKWQDSHVWSAFALCAFFLIPLAVLLSNLNIVHLLSETAMITLIITGLSFSLGMACFTLSLRKTGLAPAFSLNIILSTSIGTLAPLFLFHKSQLLSLYSLLIYCGVLLFSLSIFFLYFSTPSEINTLKKNDKITGMILAALSGILTSGQSSAYNYAINELNTGDLLQLLNKLSIWSIFFISSFSIFFLIHAPRSRNQFSAFFQYKMHNSLLIMIMAALYYLSIALFSYSTSYISVPVSWPIFMISIVLTTNFWSIKLKEFHGIRKNFYCAYLIATLMAFLFFAFSMQLGV